MSEDDADDGRHEGEEDESDGRLTPEQYEALHQFDDEEDDPGWAPTPEEASGPSAAFVDWLYKGDGWGELLDYHGLDRPTGAACVHEARRAGVRALVAYARDRLRADPRLKHHHPDVREWWKDHKLHVKLAELVNDFVENRVRNRIGLWSLKTVVDVLDYSLWKYAARRVVGVLVADLLITIVGGKGADEGGERG
jgi:hypothetical protein